jgi:hypothetical protein
MCYKMTEFLEEAIKRVRERPEAVQDEAARNYADVCIKRCRTCTSRRRDAKGRARRQAQASRGEFVSDEEMAAFFKRHGG